MGWIERSLVLLALLVPILLRLVLADRASVPAGKCCTDTQPQYDRHAEDGDSSIDQRRQELFA